MIDLPTRLLPTMIRRAEVDMTWWFHEAERGVTVAMLQHPDYWTSVARKFKPNDRIDVVAQDGSFDLDLRIIAVDQARGLWAQVRVLRLFESEALPDTDERDAEGYRIEFGGAHKFRIIDRAGNVVAKYLPSRAAAGEELAKLKGLKNLVAA